MFHVIWRNRHIWLPIVGLLLVLLVTWLLVPRAQAPFLYEFF
ncbi:MAG: hypothetical protein Q8P18_02915 [Pseudomonadota bacterium]|nr:hypothetical protein [Pseudomonadota bacterium]